MDDGRQRGSSLLETAVALAIGAVMAGAATGAAAIVLHASAGSGVRDALQSALRREMSLAVDGLKYRGGSLLPAVSATTLPMPTGSPLPARLALRTKRLQDGAIRIDIDATALGTHERQTLSSTLDSQAPLPGASVTAPGLVAAPTGAP